MIDATIAGAVDFVAWVVVTLFWDDLDDRVVFSLPLNDFVGFA